MTCVHRWQIEPANGPTSDGVCSRCGERKTFANSFADSFDRLQVRRPPRAYLLDPLPDAHVFGGRRIFGGVE